MIKKKKEKEIREKKKIKVWKLNLKPFLMMFGFPKLCMIMMVVGLISILWLLELVVVLN